MLIKFKKGIALIEVIISMAVMSLILSVIVTMVLGSLVTVTTGSDKLEAQNLADEGIEAVRSIRDRAYNEIDFSQTGITDTLNQWDFSGEGTTENIGKYTRTITFSDVCRDSFDDIVTCPGLYIDIHTKLATSTVTWNSRTGGLNTINVTSYISNWESADLVQTNWSGGSGQGIWSDSTKYSTDDGNINIGVNGEVSLALASNGSWTTTGAQTFTDTNDIDFNNGTYTSNTQIFGSGAPADVILTQSQNWEIHADSGQSFGSSFTDTTDTDFNSGVYTQTEVSGTGIDSKIQLVFTVSWGPNVGGGMPTNENYLGISAISPSDVWAVGKNGVLAHFDGVSWTSVISPIGNNINSVDMVTSNDVWAVGKNGSIIHYNGTSWSTVSSPTGNNINAIDMLSSSDGWAVGKNGSIIHYNGTSWSTVSSPTNNNLYAVKIISANDVWASGKNGTMIHYNGTSWSNVNTPTNEDLNGMYVLSPNDIWAVGDNGTIIHYNGSLWSTVSSPTGEDFFAVSAVSATDVWAVGKNGVIAHYNGTSWSLDPNSGAGGDVNSIVVLDVNNIMTVGNNGESYGYTEGYAPTGTFISQVFDSGIAGTNWGVASWSETLPLGSDVTIATRTGNTSTPDGTWSGWSGELTISAGSAITSGNARYIQYRATLTRATDPNQTSELLNITLAVQAQVQTFNDVAILSGGTAWAVGDAGVLAYYNGINWNGVSAPTTQNLNTIEVISLSDIWVGGNNGIILHYNGTTWSIHSTVADDVFTISAVNVNDIWAAGNLGRIYHYNGTSWSNFTSPTGQAIYTIDMITANDGWLGDKNGTFYHYNGSNWSNGGSAPNRIYSIDMVASNDGWAVGRNGFIYHYNGTSWSNSGFTANDDLNSIHMISSTEGWAVGKTQNIKYYNGTIWTTKTSPINEDFEAVSILNSNEGWIVGANGVILELKLLYDNTGTFQSRVFDSGDVNSSWDNLNWGEVLPIGASITVATRTGNTAIPDGSWSGWSAELITSAGSFITSGNSRYLQYRATINRGTDPLQTPKFENITITIALTTKTLNKLSIVNENDIWGVGNSGMIIHYNGTSWSQVTSPTGQNLYSIDMYSSTDGWIVGNNGIILRYNGVSWSNFTSPTGNRLRAVDIISSTDAWIAGRNGIILHWNGTSWNSVSSPATIELRDIKMLSSIDGWIVGNNGVILKYDGVSWASHSSPTTSTLYSIDMISGTQGWAVGKNGRMIKYDSGIWTIASTIVVNTLYSVDLLSATNGWAVGNAGDILKFDGISWSSFVSPTSERLYDVKMVNSNEGWAVGRNGVIIHFLNTGAYQSSGTFISSAYNSSALSAFELIEWDEDLTGCTGCAIKFQIRVAPDNTGSPGIWTGWYGATGISTYFTSKYGNIISSSLNDNQWIQYQVFLTGDGTTTPILQEVRINYR